MSNRRISNPTEVTVLALLKVVLLWLLNVFVLILLLDVVELLLV